MNILEKKGLKGLFLKIQLSETSERRANSIQSKQTDAIIKIREEINGIERVGE